MNYEFQLSFKIKGERSWEILSYVLKKFLMELIRELHSASFSVQEINL